MTKRRMREVLIALMNAANMDVQVEDDPDEGAFLLFGDASPETLHDYLSGVRSVFNLSVDSHVFSVVHLRRHNDPDSSVAFFWEHRETLLANYTEL